MTRALVIKSVRDFLKSAYHGPVAIHPETSAEELSPPYAVVRVGSSEAMYPGVAEVWDMTILIGVFHDADTTTPEDAEAAAAEVFALLDDPAALEEFTAGSLVWSALERHGAEASIAETRWQHVAAFRAIVAPAAD